MKPSKALKENDSFLCNHMKHYHLRLLGNESPEDKMRLSAKQWLKLVAAASLWFF